MRAILIFLMLAGTAFSEGLPIPSSKTSPYQDMVWNKWETDNFIILSLDFSFGNKIRSSVEQRKDAILSRLGLDHKPLPSKCKLVCVQDGDRLKRLFSIDRPKFEIKRDREGQVEGFAIWMDEDGVNLLDSMIAGIWLHDRPMFFREGLPIILMGHDAVSEVALSSETHPSCRIFSSTERTPSTVADSVLACLFLRREFGIDVFSALLSSEDADPVSMCGFLDDESMDKTMKRYSENLKSDMKSGKTPHWYLEE